MMKHKKKKHQVGENEASLIGTQAATTKALEALASTGVVAALRSQKQGIADLLQNTDRSLSIKLSVVYGAGLIVQSDDDEWEALCQAEEWASHPKLKPKRNDALRAVLRLAVGFDGKKSDSTVHRYYKALSPLFFEKVPASELPVRIHEAGGIEKMRQSGRTLLNFAYSPPISATLQAVRSETVFKLWVKCTPAIEGVSDVEILKVKRPKGAKAMKA